MKTKKLLAIIFFMLSLFIHCYAQVDLPNDKLLSLEEAINLALGNNYDIKLEKYNQEIEENNVSRAVSGQMPQLNLNLNYEYGYSNSEIQTLGTDPEASNSPIELDGTNQAFSLSPEISVPIFNGFRLKYRYKQLEVSRNVSEQRVNQTVERTISSTVSAYLEIARLQAQLAINQEIIELSADRYNRTVEDSKFGAANSVRKLQAQVDLKTDSANYRNTLLAYENSIRDLNLLMAQSLDMQYKVEEEVLLTDALSYEALLTEMKSNNSQINLSMLNVKNADYQHEIARASVAPQISGYANYSYLNSEDEANFLQSQIVYGPTLGIRMSWNVFNGGANKIQRQNSAIQLQQQQVALNNTQLTLEKDLLNVYAQYINNKEQLRIEQANLAIYQLNYDKTSEDFKLGLVDASDVRNAQLNLSSAKNRINDLTYSIKQSEITLLELSGRLKLNDFQNDTN